MLCGTYPTENSCCPLRLSGQAQLLPHPGAIIASTGAEGTTDSFLNKKANRGCCRIETTRRAPSKLNPDDTEDKSCTVYTCDAIDDFKADVNEAEMATCPSSSARSTGRGREPSPPPEKRVV